MEGAAASTVVRYIMAKERNVRRKRFKKKEERLLVRRHDHWEVKRKIIEQYPTAPFGNIDYVLDHMKLLFHRMYIHNKRKNSACYQIRVILLTKRRLFGRAKGKSSLTSRRKEMATEPHGKTSELSWLLIYL